MKNHKTTLLLASMLVAFTAGAQEQTSVSGSEDQINFAYAGDDTRFGIGIDNEGELIGDFLKSFNTNWNSNWMGEVWLSDGAGGLKLDYHKLSGASIKGDLINNEENVRIWKYFAAVDQNTFDDRKFTVGFGSEARDKFWNVNLSSAITGSRLVNQASSSVTSDIFGQLDNRDFRQSQTIETIIRNYEHPYDWGLGGRIGKFFENQMVRLTGGLDYEQGDFSSDQLTGSINLEKYFKNTGHSLALSVEQIEKSGDFETDKSDTRANLMYRYDFGQSYLPTTVDEEVQVLDEDRLKQLKLENRQLIQNQVDLSSMAFFDLDKAEIRSDAAAELKSLVEQIKTTELASSINIVGHTCDIASEAYNLDLSKRRANSAKAFFADHGINADIIQTNGMGESQPAYDNNGPDQAKNRRVEITFLTIENEYVEVDIADEDLPMKWVKRKVDAPAAWINRALRNPAQHKRTVDVYKYQETETNTTLGEVIFLNAEPVANDDGITIDRNSSGTVIDVLSNDNDEDEDDTLSIESTSPASFGTVVNNGTAITYTPIQGFIGTDTFTYTITDGEGGSDTATVTITVNNVAPIANNDSAMAQIGIPVVINFLSNDSDPDGDDADLELVDITNQTPGILYSGSVDGGTITFVFEPGFTGVTDFTYTIQDSDGATASATITVTVNDPNEAPIAVNDHYFTTINRSTTINLLSNDSDPDGDMITLVSVNTEGSLGTVIDINADGTVTYVPPADWCGLDSFTYTITDGTQQSTATVTIQILD
ncbi:Ig-like domain-containing protein [Marinicella litoralis]|uniref:Outer membrane protein OmpA-like peptidoglycan-associated protein n=1 Tax=Marinicella litoralis TaxID=644220 RepID=A0A4R6XTT2_9GAMM|nr:Ig-like domain-containing protein [Marinicella litoralis]TDR23186.1 outer membrane protein OmpA-like peptidoglycan-associated protein [Marinicella litoralis]